MCSQGSTLCRVGEKEEERRSRGLAVRMVKRADALDASTVSTLVPSKSLAPRMVYQQSCIAFFDVGAKEGKDFSKQVHVDLKNLAMGREGRRVERRRCLRGGASGLHDKAVKRG